MNAEEIQKKRAQFAKKISESADDAAALLDMGKACFLAECYDQAVTAYKASLAVEGKNAAGYYNLGIAYEAMGKYVDAKSSFLKALEIDPNYEAAQEALNKLTEY
jgi:tetratricopeptide (TPR) repeat protein